MGTNCSATYYTVARKRKSSVTLFEFFQQLANLDESFRYAPLGDDRHLALCGLEINGAIVSGQIVRAVTGQLPFILENGVVPKPIGSDEPIGHGAAFRYSSQLNIVAIQKSHNSPGLGDLLAFVANKNPDCQPRLTVVIDQTAWSRFAQSGSRKITIGTAGVMDFSDASEDTQQALRPISAMRQSYEGHVVSVTVTAEKNRSLRHNIVNVIREILSLREANQINLRTLTSESDAETAEPPINLLNEVLRDREELAFDPSDPIKDYQARRDFLERKLSARSTELGQVARRR